MNVKRFIIIDKEDGAGLHYHDQKTEKLCLNFDKAILQNIDSVSNRDVRSDYEHRFNEGRYVIYFAEHDAYVINVYIGDGKSLPPHYIPELIHKNACMRNSASIDQKDNICYVIICDRKKGDIYGSLLFASKDDSVYSYFTRKEMLQIIERL